MLNDDLQSEPSPVTETSSNTAGGGARRVKLPLKLELADADAVELLDKWDPTTHVGGLGADCGQRSSLHFLLVV